MTEPTPRPEDPAGKKPTPMADWMAVWAEEDAREAAREEPETDKSEADTHVLTPAQIWGESPAGTSVDVVPIVLGDGEPAAPVVEEKAPSRDELDPALDGEIRRLLERTARYVKKPEVDPPEGVRTTPGASKPFLDFETPPGAWSAMTPPPLAFDEAANYRDETGGRLGLLDPVERPWHNPPTPHGAPKKRLSNPPLAPFDPPSMTSPLPDPPAARKKPSGPPRTEGQAVVAPIPWTDPPPPSQAARERSTTRRMRDTARRVKAAIAPIAAAATAEPAAPWLTLGTVAVSAAWLAVAYAASNMVFAAVGAAFLAPFAISALGAAARRGQRP
ncbi:MAG: hypothetical protein AAB074_08105 [Planctomycetota bacterium]